MQPNEAVPGKEPDAMTQRNFALLLEHQRSPMTAESIGGNAAKIRIDGDPWSCYAINGIMDPHTGEVLEYGNHIANDKPNIEHFAIIIAVPPVQKILEGVSEIFLEIRTPTDHPNLSSSSRDTLMRMKPLWDEHAKVTTAREFTEMHARQSESPAITKPARWTIEKLWRLLRPGSPDENE